MLCCGLAACTIAAAALPSVRGGRSAARTRRAAALVAVVSSTAYNYRKTTPHPGITELRGMSVFYKNDAGEVSHTCSSFARGYETTVGAFGLFDMTPRGRNETTIMDWVGRSDEHAAPAAAGAPTRRLQRRAVGSAARRSSSERASPHRMRGE